MKFLDEYRDRDPVQHMARAIGRITTRPWTLMEVCGGQTHTIVKTGLRICFPKRYRWCTVLAARFASRPSR